MLRIGEISEIYGIPVTTLHFWENKGLFHAQRNAENGYREFDLGKMLVELGDVVFYRNLGIPLKELQSIRLKNSEEKRELLENSRETVFRQIDELQKKAETIDAQLSLLDEVLAAREIRFTEEPPPFRRAVRFNHDDKEHIKKYLQNPNDFVNIGKPEDKLHDSDGLIVPDSYRGGEIIWERKPKRYLKSYFKIRLYDYVDTDFYQALDALSALGEKPVAYVSQYMINVFDGESQYDYYRVWFEVE